MEHGASRSWRIRFESASIWDPLKCFDCTPFPGSWVHSTHQSLGFVTRIPFIPRPLQAHEKRPNNHRACHAQSMIARSSSQANCASHDQSQHRAIESVNPGAHACDPAAFVGGLGPRPSTTPVANPLPALRQHKSAVFLRPEAKPVRLRAGLSVPVCVMVRPGKSVSNTRAIVAFGSDQYYSQAMQVRWRWFLSR